MARYIDAEKQEKDGWWATRNYKQDAKTNVYETKKMTDFPTADVVEVVRCKDCKHRDKYECNHIMLGGTKCGVTDDWFCADGERRDGAKLQSNIE